MIPGQVPPGPESYPYKLGQSAAGDPKKHAFLVLGRDERRISTQALVLNLFWKHRVKIASHFGYFDDVRREFVLCLSCDLRNADITADGLVVELRLIKSVTHARSISSENRLFDGFFFPITLLDNRVIVLDSQITFLIEHQLSTPEEKEALTEVGRIYALDIIRQIRSKFPDGTSDPIIQENVNDYFKAAGMGRFSLPNIEGKTAQATIREPPLSERGEATGNHFIHGIVIGLLEVFQRREMRVAEDLYDKKTARLFIGLIDKNSQLRAPMPDEVKARALEEVEKVINSIEQVQAPPTPMPVAAMTNASSPSLNQVLKTYESEGWIGGKIGIAPEPRQSSNIVVKYPLMPVPAPQVKQEIIPPKPETKQEIPQKSVESVNPPVLEVRKSKKKPTEEEVARAFRAALSDKDAVVFDEESYYSN